MYVDENLIYRSDVAYIRPRFCETIPTRGCWLIPYLGYVDDVPFHNLEQGVLDTLSGHIPAYAHVPTRLADLVTLVNVDDTPLTTLNILTALQVQL